MDNGVTIRTFLNYRGRWAHAAMLICLALFITSRFFEDPLFAWGLVLISLIGFVIVAGVSSKMVCCPRCKGQMLRLANYLGSMSKGSIPVRFCPYCGVNLDEQK